MAQRQKIVVSGELHWPGLSLGLQILALSDPGQIRFRDLHLLQGKCVLNANDARLSGFGQPHGLQAECDGFELYTSPGAPPPDGSAIHCESAVELTYVPLWSDACDPVSYPAERRVG